MENLDDDGISTEDEEDDMSMETLHLPGSNIEEAVEDKSQKYEEDFPPIQQHNNAKNWGPVQATKMSARVAGDTGTILQKAQQFKCT